MQGLRCFELFQKKNELKQVESVDITYKLIHCKISDSFDLCENGMK